MANDIARPMPANLDAERALLGSCLIKPGAAIEAVSLLHVDDFSLKENRAVFRAFQVLTAQDSPVDLVTTVDVLTNMHKLDEAGGIAYVSSLPDGLPRVTNLAGYAAIIKQRSIQRRLIRSADSIQRRAFDGEAGLIESAVTEILGIAGDNTVTARSWNEVAESVIAECETAVAHPDLSRRVKFGLADLDEALGGLRRRHLVEIVAPTSNGKTLLATQAAIRADEDGFKVLFFSAEMPAGELVLREIAYRARVPYYFARTPERLNANELNRMREAAKRPHGIKIVERDITPARIWAMAEAMKRTSGLDLVIVDYDQLVIEAGINPDSDEDNVFRHQRAFIFQTKKLAERLDIVFVILAQLRKLSPAVLKGAQPHLDDVWGDSAARNTPQVILWVSREFFIKGMDPAYERDAKVYVLKNRSGRTGVVNLAFDPEHVRFEDAPPGEADSIPEAQWEKHTEGAQR